MNNLIVENIAKEVLRVQKEEIKNLGIIGGMTNLNYLVQVKDEKYVVRIPGNGTSSMINRKHELKNLRLGSKIGINPELIYFNEETGVKITKKIEQSKPISKKK